MATKKKTAQAVVHERELKPFASPPRDARKGDEWTHPKTGAVFVFNGSWWQNQEEAGVRK